MQHSDIDVEIIGDIICPTSEEDSCTWFLQALPVREPVFTVATCHWDPRLSKRGPIGDPIFSEMGTLGSRMGTQKANVCKIDRNKIIY